MTKQLLFASDFDQTLSFNDSGRLLSERLGIGGFDAKVEGLSRLNLVQEGAELIYLLRHDPEYRRVRREDLVEVGRTIRLKRNIALLRALLESGIDGHRADFFVVSAAPEEIVQTALAGIIPRDHIIGTRLVYDDRTGEIASIDRVAAGYGKVAAIEALCAELGVLRDRVVYVGDGSSDLHVMLHVNRCDGLTIAVSQARSVTEVARRTVISDDALAVLIPVLEEVMGWTHRDIRRLLERHGFVIQEWDRVRTDWLTIVAAVDDSALPAEGGSAPRLVVSA